MIEARRTDKKRRPKPPPRSRVTRLVFVRGGGYLDVVLDRNHALDALGDRGGAIGLVLAAGGARQLHDAVVSLNLDMGRADALFLGEFPLDLGGDRRVGNAWFCWYPTLWRPPARSSCRPRYRQWRYAISYDHSFRKQPRMGLPIPRRSTACRARLLARTSRPRTYQVSAATDFRDTGEPLTRLSDNA